MRFADALVNINGEFTRGEDATVSVLDRSFVYGDGVFEGIAVHDNHILLLDDHIDRLYRSASHINIDIPIEKSELKDRIITTAEKNDMTEGYIRPLISRGTGPFGIANFDALEGPDIYIIPRPDTEARTITFSELEPASAWISSIRKTPPASVAPRVKANNYLNNIQAELDAHAAGADTAILLDTTHGHVTEATGANIFTITDGVLRTPPDQQILSGTTRNKLLEITSDSALVDVIVEELTPYDLYHADECFLTNSLIGVSPITEIDDRQIGSGSIGEITRKLNSRLADSVLEDSASVKVL